MQRFEFDDGQNEKVDPAEARRVVEQWMVQQHDATQDWPSVQDLAEALRTTPDQVRRMLSQVRSAPPAPVTAQRRPLVSAKVWHFGLACVAGSVFLSVLFSGLGSARHIRHQRVVTPPAAFPQGVIATIPGEAAPFDRGAKAVAGSPAGDTAYAPKAVDVR